MINNIYISNEQKFNEWLAGLIDGDGCLLIAQERYASCEITMGINDHHTLIFIQDKLASSGRKAYRYRLHYKEGMINLVERINGNIRNSKRVPQLLQICNLYNISYIQAITFTCDNAWFAGFFDADGTIVCEFDRASPDLRISVCNKFRVDIEPFLIFGGSIVYNKSGYGSYIWRIGNKINILSMLEYFKCCPSISHKLYRLQRVEKYYFLKDLKAHKTLNEEWLFFKKQWKNWE